MLLANKKLLPQLSVLLCAGWLAALLAGCEQEGPAERAGKEVDRAVEDMTTPKGPAERAGENIDKAAKEAGEALEEAGDKIEEATK